MVRSWSKLQLEPLDQVELDFYDDAELLDSELPVELFWTNSTISPALGRLAVGPVETAALEDDSLMLPNSLRSGASVFQQVVSALSLNAGPGAPFIAALRARIGIGRHENLRDGRNPEHSTGSSASTDVGRVIPGSIRVDVIVAVALWLHWRTPLSAPRR